MSHWVLLGGLLLIVAILGGRKRLPITVPLVLVALSLIAVAKAAPGPEAREAKACALGDRLRAAGRLDTAADNYVKVLDEGGEHTRAPSCVLDGLAEVERLRCQAAERLRKAGLTTKAQELYSKVLENPASPEDARACAKEGATTTLTTSIAKPQASPQLLPPTNGHAAR